MNSPLFCGNCRTLHPATDLSHFELIGLPPRYDLDATELRRKYLHCSRDIHPDHHGGVPEKADLSLRTSARLNEAYRILSDPLLRAEYLLELLGGKSSAEDKTVPQEVLAQTLLFREEIEEAQAASDHDALAVLEPQVRALRDAAMESAVDLARRLPGSDELRVQLRQKLNAIKYYQKLLEQL